MEREIIEEKLAEEVTGGSIVFNGAHTTCGRDCNNQYKVNDYNAVIKYIADHRHEMSEKKMLNNMVAAGLLSAL